VDRLSDGKARELDIIRQVILLATPNLGSGLFSPLRNFLSHFIPNPQERSLQLLNEEISDLREEVAEKIVRARTRDGTHNAIPFQCFWGMSDRVVVEASARGPFPNALPLRGDHSDIIQPNSSSDDRYLAIKDAFLKPSGHENIFELSSYSTELRVEPSTLKIEDITPPLPKRIEIENIAHLKRVVEFSSKNHCFELYQMRYFTEESGFVRATMSHPNEAAPDLLHKYELSGTEIYYDFTPAPSTRYWFDVEVFNGFGPGNRDWHFHLGHKSYYKRYEFSLDIRAYIEAGYKLSLAPSFFYYPIDPVDHALCAQRVHDSPEPYASETPGLWRWELNDVREGVIDLIWNLEEKELGGESTHGSRA